MCIFWSKPLDLAKVDLTQWQCDGAEDWTCGQDVAGLTAIMGMTLSNLFTPLYLEPSAELF